MTTTVAVTGVSGYIGRVVAQRLGDDPNVARIVGIDMHDPSFSVPKLEFYKMDVRSPRLVDAFSGCDAVVHLAAIGAGEPAEIRDVNVGGTRAVADAAVNSGVSRLVYVSSHRVYGFHPDNEHPLTEESLVRPSHDDAYGASKAEAEGVVGYYGEDHPDIHVAVLRFAWVCGPTIPTSHAGFIDAKVAVGIDGYSPPCQVLHESDAAEAVAFAITGLEGTFNVAAPDAIDPGQVLDRRVVTLSLDRAKRVLDRTAKLGLTVTGAELHVLMYPQFLSSEKIHDAGCKPFKGTEEALREAVAARRGWIGLGHLHFRPKRIALATGTLGAVLAGRALSSKRKAKRETA